MLRLGIRQWIAGLTLGVMMLGGTVSAQTVPAKPAAQPQTIDIDEGVIQPIPIAVSLSGGGAQNDLSAKIAQVVSADLERSGYFAPIDPNAFIQHDLDGASEPRFDDWQTIHAADLASGRVMADAAGHLTVELHLWDVFGKQQLVGRSLETTTGNWRRVAHQIADIIYAKLTGYGPYFDSRVAFVAESGPHGRRSLRLALMDQDGANETILSDGAHKIMSPRFSADGSKIAYMALSLDSARLYIWDLATGRSEPVATVKGMAFAPRFSPDGTKLAFTVDQGGNSDIYLMDLNTHALSRLTHDAAIDTSPSFSSNGAQIAFNSDRGGSPQLYIMNLDGSNAHRISFGGGRYTTPVFSPDGQTIAFTKQVGGRFSVGIMKPDGSGEKLLTSSYFEEGPTWAPNGRYILFFREPAGGLPSVWSVDITGRIEKPIPYTGGASDPSWSPLMK